MKLGYWPNLGKLHIYPKGSKLSLFSFYGQSFLRYWTFLKIAIFGHETWPLAKVPEVAHILSPGVEIELIFDLQATVQRYRPFFNIAIFGYEIWPLGAKFQKLYIYSLSTPGGRNRVYFRSTGSGFRDMGRLSKLPYLGMKLGQSSRSCTYTVFQTHGSEIELIFALRAAVSEIRDNNQNCHIWA